MLLDRAHRQQQDAAPGLLPNILAVQFLEVAHPIPLFLKTLVSISQLPNQEGKSYTFAVVFRNLVR